jgi:hypothetical protein
VAVIPSHKIITAVSKLTIFSTLKNFTSTQQERHRQQQMGGIVIKENPMKAFSTSHSSNLADERNSLPPVTTPESREEFEQDYSLATTHLKATLYNYVDLDQPYNQ